mmetsp:Transcript_6927/g.22980  ORF Transcript_6927/g.22980 Transcript_6927/m.22980 type:complete len:399 (+) Transcript_6927:298-1494(+)
MSAGIWCWARRAVRGWSLCGATRRRLAWRSSRSRTRLRWRTASHTSRRLRARRGFMSSAARDTCLRGSWCEPRPGRRSWRAATSCATKRSPSRAAMAARSSRWRSAAAKRFARSGCSWRRAPSRTRARSCPRRTARATSSSTSSSSRRRPSSSSSRPTTSRLSRACPPSSTATPPGTGSTRSRRSNTPPARSSSSSAAVALSRCRRTVGRSPPRPGSASSEVNRRWSTGTAAAATSAFMRTCSRWWMNSGRASLHVRSRFGATPAQRRIRQRSAHTWARFRRGCLCARAATDSQPRAATSWGCARRGPSSARATRTSSPRGRSRRAYASSARRSPPASPRARGGSAALQRGPKPSAPHLHDRLTHARPIWRRRFHPFHHSSYLYDDTKRTYCIRRSHG